MAAALVTGRQQGHSRFMDVANEPVRHLLPIKGYENMPLVSLEEAVKPIFHLFTDLDEYVSVSKKNCRSPKDGLTQDEAASIQLYTMEFDPEPSFYAILNETLRRERRQDLKPWFSYLKLFFTAMHKLPSHKMCVWRGVRGVNLCSEYEIGKEIVWWGVSSCAEQLQVLENNQFLGKEGIRTIFSIECLHGKKIAAYSYYKGRENEVILIPGSQFLVTSILEPAPGLHIIQMKETENDYSTEVTLILNNNSGKTETVVYTPIIDPKPQDQSIQGNEKHATKLQSSNAPKETTTVVNIPPTPVKPNPEWEPPPYPDTISPWDKSKERKPLVTNYAYEKERCSCCPTKGDTCIFILLCLLLLLPTGTLTVGMLYKNECPIQTWIPTWLIVFGAVGLAISGILIFIFIIICCCCHDSSDREAGGGLIACVTVVALLFFLAWLIAGSVWVFPIDSKVQFNQTINETYCNEIIYKSTFGTLIAQYSLIGLLACILSCLWCIIKCCE